MHKHRRVWLHWLLVVLGSLALAACSHSQRATMKSCSAEEFFDGRQLELARAIGRNDENAIRTAALGLDLSTPGRKEMTFLWFAMVGTGKPNLDAIRTLISLGVDPDRQIAQGIGSTLDYAFLNKETSVLAAMLDGGLPPNHTSPRHKPMLQRAVAASLAHTRLLVERGADPNMRDSIGGSAIYEALAASEPSIAIFLLQSGARADVATVNGVTPAWSTKRSLDNLQAGPLKSQFEMFRDLLIEKGVKWPPDPPEVVRDQMRLQGLKVIVPAGRNK